MSTTTSSTAPVIVPLRRGHLLAVIVAAIVLSAAVTWTVSRFAVGTSATQSGRVTQQKVTPAASRPAVRAKSREAVIMSITPAALAAGALGGYALPSLQHGPTLQSVLASMSPATRRYTQAVMNLTFAQLKAGAAGSP